MLILYIVSCSAPPTAFIESEWRLDYFCNTSDTYTSARRKVDTMLDRSQRRAQQLEIPNIWVSLMGGEVSILSQGVESCLSVDHPIIDRSSSAGQTDRGLGLLHTRGFE